MSTLPKTFLTPEQYLEIERKAEYRSEYHNGEMFAMAGATRVHTKLVRNITGQLYQQLRTGSCNWYFHDMRVCVSATGLYTYPDVVIVCGEERFLDGELDTLLNPTAIVEVLSRSTEAYDRGEKFALYRTIESLREYVLVSFDRVRIERYTRQAGDHWLLTAADKLEDTIALESANCQLRLADVYERVELAVPV